MKLNPITGTCYCLFESGFLSLLRDKSVCLGVSCGQFRIHSFSYPLRRILNCSSFSLRYLIGRILWQGLRPGQVEYPTTSRKMRILEFWKSGHISIIIMGAADTCPTRASQTISLFMLLSHLSPLSIRRPFPYAASRSVVPLIPTFLLHTCIDTESNRTSTFLFRRRGRCVRCTELAVRLYLRVYTCIYYHAAVGWIAIPFFAALDADHTCRY
jgi:hypothetical protein